MSPVSARLRTSQSLAHQLGEIPTLKFIYNVKLGKRFNHIVADKIAIKKKDVIVFRNNTIILSTNLDLLEDHIKEQIAH
ncbi:MAG: hypothetical protein NWE83_07635 [Candidatus Bathyarchaeota archaeon]|jgi:hypothetical protein|nr:hypothetical protein [Candidatus Bathyarchaeota archaeon]